MTPDEFLKELGKRKAELKLKLSRIAEAKSDEEITDFRLSNAKNEYLLEASPLLHEMKFAGPLYPALTLFFSISFPYLQAWGEEDNFYFNGSYGNTLEKSLEAATEHDLKLEENSDYQTFVHKIYDRSFDHFNQMKALAKNSDYPVLQLSGHEFFRRVLWKSGPIDNAQHEKGLELLAEHISQESFFDNIIVTFQQYIDRLGPKLYDVSMWLVKKRKATNQIEIYNSEFNAYSEYLRNFLDTCSKDPNLKDLVPSYEQMLADAEKKEESITMSKVMPQTEISAEPKNKTWMYLAGAAAAAYYLLS